MALDSSPPNNSYWFCHLWHSNWLYPAKGLDYEFSIEIGIETNSSVPYRMGFCFSKQQSCWVIVTLMSGEMISGRYATKSFASSDIDKRDLYLEDVYTINEQSVWHHIDGNEGVLILGESIKCIEFFTGGNYGK